MIGINADEIEKTMNNILKGLYDYYFKYTYNSEHFNNLETGGVYEHKLAKELGYTLEEKSYTEGVTDVPPDIFLEAAKMLERNGYVRRVDRKKDFPVKGIYLTSEGFKKAKYLKLSWFGKVQYALNENWTTIFINVIAAFIITIITLFVSSLFGLFGLGK